MKQQDYILANETEVLNFLKSRYPLYHLSNVFFRDVQYGIQTMLDPKGMSVGYADAEKIARAFVDQLEKKKVLSPIDRQSWVLHHPEFKKPTVVSAAPAKPAAKPAAPAAAAPGAAKPSLPPLSRPAVGATKPGGLPPISRPAAGTPSKPGGLPPLKSAASQTPAVQPTPVAEAKAPTPAVEAPQPPTSTVESAKPAVAPTPPAPIPPGGKKPLPPLRSGSPAGPKK